MTIHIPKWALYVATFIGGWVWGLAHAALNRATNN
ncbi:hypothetical protein LMG28688_00815 [Paraburkholderia caffeinitolerans]|uniref:Uncharacterized protein n=1 Tax=Paraburkholderia caffeinitolerans TaxID=1723730 RepID=A0A6J5FK32_9BURK|nr:hypothetical protein LMG28688_00815 [Paraburkholderia caffeinitolerans]